MKKLIITLVLPITIFTLSTAQSTIGFQNDIKNIGTLNGSTVMNHDGKITSENLNQQTITGITTFNNSSVKGNQYLFDTWTNGSVTDLKNTNYATDYTFNFDKLNQNVYAKYNGGANITVILDNSQIKKFTIGSMNFIDAALVDPKSKGMFYQVLVDGASNVSLYKHTRTKFVKADPNDMINIKTGNFGSEYVDDNTYFVSINHGELKRVMLSERSLSKSLVTYSAKTDTYFNAHSGSDLNEGYLIDLVQYLNQ